MPGDFPWVNAALLTGIVFVALLTLEPHVAFLLAPARRYRSTARGTPDLLDPDGRHGKDERYEWHYRALRQAGFEPLGIVREELGRALLLDEYAFGNGPPGVLAEIACRSGALTFLTADPAGRVVATVLRPGERAVRDGYCYNPVGPVPVAHALELHARAVDDILGGAAQALPATALADLPPILRAMTLHPATVSALRAGVWWLAAGILLVPPIFTLVVGALLVIRGVLRPMNLPRDLLLGPAWPLAGTLGLIATLSLLTYVKTVDRTVPLGGAEGTAGA